MKAAKAIAYLNVRLDKNLKKQLEKLAEADNRSLSNYVVAVLNAHLRRVVLGPYLYERPEWEDTGEPVRLPKGVR